MASCAIRLNDIYCMARCGRCGQASPSGTGPELVFTESATPICRECASKVTPPLAALLRLAQVAERIGRMKRHMLMPPLEALLELAGAAEGYAEQLGPWRCRPTVKLAAECPEEEPAVIPPPPATRKYPSGCVA